MTRGSPTDSADTGLLRSRIRALEQELARLRDVDSHLRGMMESARGFAIYRIAKVPDAPFGSQVVFVSPSIREILAPRDPDDFSTWFETIHPEDRARVEAAERQSAPQSQPFKQIMRVRGPDSETWRWVQAVSYPVLDARGVPTHYDGIMIDVTRSRLAEEALRLRDRAIQASSNAVVIARVDAAGYPVVFVNPAFERLTGYGAAEFVGSDGRLLFLDSSARGDRQTLENAWRQLRPADVTLSGSRKDGSQFWAHVVTTPVADDAGAVTHFVTVLADMTRARQDEATLRHQATHDELTGLPNRVLLQDRLDHAIATADRGARQVVVAFLDLDNFKHFNNSLGHEWGDTVLLCAASRIAGCMRQGDTVARYGGDEFVLILSMHESASDTDAVLQRIHAAVSRPLEVRGTSHRVTCSIGYCQYPEDGADPGTLLRNADAAMYEAKAAGRDTTRRHSPHTGKRLFERLTLEASLRVAAERDEIALAYQPIIDVASGRIVAAEALARWHDREHGQVSPGRFIPLAEETGLIVDIGRNLLHRATRDAVLWEQAGLGDLDVWVNLSARQFHAPDVVQVIEGALRESGLPPERLEVELTESLVMPQPEQVHDTLEQLRAMGVKLSIDDFGTGYSSLAYLRRFPVTTLKIDRSFLRNVPADSDNVSIVNAVSGLGHSLGLSVVAEGVENAAQLAVVRCAGCDTFQGFLVSPALAHEAFVTFVRTYTPACTATTVVDGS